MALHIVISASWERGVHALPKNCLVADFAADLMAGSVAKFDAARTREQGGAPGPINDGAQMSVGKKAGNAHTTISKLGRKR